MRSTSSRCCCSRTRPAGADGCRTQNAGVVGVVGVVGIVAQAENRTDRARSRQTTLSCGNRCSDLNDRAVATTHWASPRRDGMEARRSRSPTMAVVGADVAASAYMQMGRGACCSQRLAGTTRRRRGGPTAPAWARGSPRRGFRTLCPLATADTRSRPGASAPRASGGSAWARASSLAAHGARGDP